MAIAVNVDRAPPAQAENQRTKAPEALKEERKEDCITLIEEMVRQMYTGLPPNQNAHMAAIGCSRATRRICVATRQLVKDRAGPGWKQFVVECKRN